MPNNEEKKSKLSYRDKGIMEELFEMEKGYVLNLSNGQFKALIAKCLNIDIYSDPKYISEESKAKKLRKLWDTENDLNVGKVILALLEKREAIITIKEKNDYYYIDKMADEAKRIKEIALAIVGDSESFENDTERFNADLASAKEVLHDLISIGERLCTTAEYDESTKENPINDFFRNMLCGMGYNETKDQTRHGISSTGIDAGEVDLLLTKEGKEIAIFEGLIPSSRNGGNIDEHIDKAIKNYNQLGTPTFIVAYVRHADFEDFWKTYFEYISNYQYDLTIKEKMKELTSPNAATKISQIILSKDGFDFPVFFMCLKMRKK